MVTTLTSNITSAAASIGTHISLVRAQELVLAGKSLPQPRSRVASAQDMHDIAAHLERVRGERAAAYLRRAKKTAGPIEAMLAVLHAASTYRSRTRFEDPVAMASLRRTLRAHFESRRLLHLVLPLGGGKAANPLKVGAEFSPDAGDWLALVLLGAIADALSEIHDPGVTVVVIPDAPLHTADLGFDQIANVAHAVQLQRDLVTLGLTGRIFIADTAQVLPAGWLAEVNARAETARRRAAEDTEFASSVADQVRSLRFTVNQRAFAWPLDHAVLVNAQLGGHGRGRADEVRQDAADIQRAAERIVFHYIGVNHALRTLDVPGRVVERISGDRQHVRLTVHAKPGEPRPNLVEDGSRARPGLIPMHSIAVRYEERGRARLATGFALEALLDGYTEVREQGTGRLLFAEAER